MDTEILNRSIVEHVGQLTREMTDVIIRIIPTINHRLLFST
jgi:hypothetical protein